MRTAATQTFDANALGLHGAELVSASSSSHASIISNPPNTPNALQTSRHPQPHPLRHSYPPHPPKMPTTIFLPRSRSAHSIPTSPIRPISACSTIRHVTPSPESLTDALHQNLILHSTPKPTPPKRPHTSEGLRTAADAPTRMLNTLRPAPRAETNPVER
jgi:hypothetical protein